MSTLPPFTAPDRQVTLVNSIASFFRDEGRVFLGSTPRLAVAAGENFNVALVNPAASGRTLLVGQVTMVSNASGLLVADVHINPDTALPATARLVTNAVLGHPTNPVGVLNADAAADPLSGGALIGHIGFTDSRTEVPFEPAIVVGEGVTVGLTLPVGGALGATDVQAAIRWVEVDA